MNNIDYRVQEVADYIIKTQSTIRKTAEIFNISKSTVHKDIRERLKYVDKEKYGIIENIFKNHIETRHILGGQSIKKKYLKLKNIEG